MKKIIIIFAFISLPSIQMVYSQIAGYVYSDSGNPLSGATITTVNGKHTVKSDTDGYFNFTEVIFPDSVSVSYVGYITRVVGLAAADMGLRIVLYKTGQTIEAVDIVNTGFYQIPKERATGSFTVVDNELLNRSVGGNILQRLDGVASGVQFVTPNGAKASDIRVRGLATIQSDATPLIVLDNFPYEGDITSINPNDIENITVLKDAAAASIWGARAGNGVIVITTKQGRYNQKGQLSLNSNVTVGEKPDLLYSRNRLPSEIVMQIEKEKYEQDGYYLPNAQQVPFPEYVEMLMALKNGSLSQQEFDRRETLMKQTEVREEAMKYLYQPSMYQQYALNARGGGDKHTYYVSGGYDRNRADVIGNDNNRINLNLQNTFKPFGSLELNTAIWYSQQKGENNGISLNDLKGNPTHIGLSPYTRLMDEKGNPLSIIRDYRQTYVDQAESIGLLDWQYRPLEERELIDRVSHTEELRANTGLKYSFLDYFNLNFTYQYVKGNSNSTVEYDKDSYYVRNMVNRFTQADGIRIVPHGGVYQKSGLSNSRSHSGRVQLDYNQEFGANHQINGLMGGEIRDFIRYNEPGYTLYDYIPDLLLGTKQLDYMKRYDTRPSGSFLLPQQDENRIKLSDRFLSYFGNISYIYRNRYLMSGSLRWDGSNLFGVKTNQKGTPLWSLGAAWELSKEPFFNLEPFGYLRLRATYGSAGNLNRSVSALPVILYSGRDSQTGLNSAMVRSIGNPSLRWERVNTLNMALDFRLFSDRVFGNAEFYYKNSSDLIGKTVLPANTGVFTGGTAENSNLINYADMLTRGIDLSITSVNIRGDFEWKTILLLQKIKNRITSHNSPLVPTSYYLNEPAVPSKGKSRDVIYAIPFYGLDATNGNLIVMDNGKVSNDYAKFYNSLSKDDLLDAGLTVPPYFGSIRNEFQYKGMSLSFLLAGKFGYQFRKSSYFSGNQLNPERYNMDYLNRWAKPGDEQWSTIPAKGNILEYYADVYNKSEALILNADQIRLQDVSLAYHLSDERIKNWGISSVRLYVYARNLGAIWKLNKESIDPDYANAEFITPKSFAFGISMDF